jgi:hypothetical protein
MPQALPANPNLDWLKKTAKQRLDELRTRQPDVKLHAAQFALAHDYGFESWRALKAHVDRISPAFRDRNRVFEAARDGDVETVRRAFASGFDPATPDSDGRIVLQIAKEHRHEAIEMLARDLQGARPVRMTRCGQSRILCEQRSPVISTHFAPASTRILSGSTHLAVDSRRPRRCIWRFCATNMLPRAC